MAEVLLLINGVRASSDGAAERSLCIEIESIIEERDRYETEERYCVKTGAK